MIVLVAGIATAGLAQYCPPTMPAVDRGQITPNGSWIAYSCPESCSSPQSPPVFLRWQPDANVGLDIIWVWCQSSMKEVPIQSDSTCWNCLGGCAGSDCPPGEICLPDKGKAGSDCRRYGCADPNYEAIENSATTDPNDAICQRKTWCPPVQYCTPATVYIDGPTKIRPDATCLWSAEAWSECGSSGYVFNWYIGSHWVGSGPDYTGGRPWWVSAGQPWKLRVEAAYNGTFAGSREIQVSESSTAMYCIQ